MQDSIDWTPLAESLLSDRDVALPGTVRCLPPPPHSVSRFLSLVDVPNVDLRDLAGLIDADTQLISELLKRANSCLYGGSTKVHSVRDAISRIGLMRTKTLVLSAAIQGALDSVTSDFIDSVTFRMECLERALFAKFVAQAIGADEHLSYVSAMLVDLVLPLLTSEYASHYQRFTSRQVPIVEFEREVFDWDHGYVAAQMMRDWGFPDELICAVLLHHDPVFVLCDERYDRTTVAACAAAALLPDFMEQSPNGIEYLLDYQRRIPELSIIGIAALVDEQRAVDENFLTRKRVALSDRLAKLAFQQLEQQRAESTVVGQRIGSYVLGERLGHGGMGVVHTAQHIMLGRTAAIKLMKSADLGATALERFEIEAQITSELTSPHTVHVYDYGWTSAGMLYYVMEYLEGIGLDELVRRYGPQSEARVIHILRQVCSSLSEAHARGLVHRDIKPENIMLTVQGGVSDFAKVLDFGIVKTARDRTSPSEPESICGTPLYLSPEGILNPSNIDERSDIYSLGAVGYLLLSGRPVFDAQSVKNILQMHVDAVPQRPSTVRTDPLDSDLEELIMMCLEKEPSHRPATCSILGSLLGKCRAAGRWTSDAAETWWSQARSDMASGERPQNLPAEDSDTVLSAPEPPDRHMTTHIVSSLSGLEAH